MVNSTSIEAKTMEISDVRCRRQLMRPMRQLGARGQVKVKVKVKVKVQAISLQAGLGSNVICFLSVLLD